jgi:hypothetical protein
MTQKTKKRKVRVSETFGFIYEYVQVRGSYRITPEGKVANPFTCLSLERADAILTSCYERKQAMSGK